MKLKALLLASPLCAFVVPGTSLASDPPPIPDHLMPPASRPQAVQKPAAAPRAVPKTGPPLSV
jgi:hypothetical protein